MDFTEINTIEKQFGDGEWKQFLHSVSISGLHGFTGQPVNFNFPICAIVGENGTGKSTILKAAACAYEGKHPAIALFPTDFFRETPWETFPNVTLSYRVRNGNQEESYSLRKYETKWSYKAKRPSRSVYFQDISRTVSLDSSIGYAKLAKVAVQETASKDISEEFRKRLAHIMGKDYERARFATTDADPKKDIGLVKSAVGEISAFHLGAGEDAMLDLTRLLEEIPKQSLLIIDEVENSLHPRAQRRLMRFLLHLSRISRIQVIISTHSPYVLEELPPRARILVLPAAGGASEIITGISPEFALTRLDEAVHPELHVFVEDRESETWLKKILATTEEGRSLLSRCRVVPVGSSNVVKTLGQVASKGRLPYRAISVLDGDEGPSEQCGLLPGDQAPEVQVFKDLKSIGWSGLPLAFSMGAGELLGWLDDALREPDHHRWPGMVGDRISLSRHYVWETMCDQWVRQCLTPDVRNGIYAKLREAIDDSRTLFE